MVSVFLQLEHKVLTAFIFTIDFFVMLLNVRSLCLIVELLDIFTFIAYTCLKVYCLLCMVSQYQEMKNGRGLRKDSFAAVMMTCNLCSKQKIQNFFRHQLQINDISFLASAETGTNNILQSKTTSSMVCGHNCSPVLQHENVTLSEYILEARICYFHP